MPNNRKERRAAARATVTSVASRRNTFRLLTVGGLVVSQAGLFAANPATATTFATVTNCDSTGPGSLAAAVAHQQDPGNGESEIHFAALSCDTIVLTDTLNFTSAVNIVGPGANSLTLKRSSADFNFMTFNAGAATISGLRLNGEHSHGSAYQGIANFGSEVLTIHGVEIANFGIDTNIQNDATETAINSVGGVTVEASTFVGNSFSFDSAIYSEGSVTVSNSTFSGNSLWEGTLISAMGFGTVFSNDFVDNTGFDDTTWSGQVMSGSIAYYGNIFADQTTTDHNYCSTTETFNGYDLGGNIFTTGIIGCDLLMPTVEPGMGLSGYMTYENLHLGSFGLHGGTTQGYTLEAGSHAIDYYSGEGLSEGAVAATTDWLGTARPQGVALDVGAYEFPVVVAPTCTTHRVGKVGFLANSSRLTPAARLAVRAIARKIVASGCTHLVLNGHTATTNGASAKTASIRTRLATARNNAVAKYLVAVLHQKGVTVTITKHALGAANPVKGNDTNANRIANRRVEVLIQADPA